MRLCLKKGGPRTRKLIARSIPMPTIVIARTAIAGARINITQDVIIILAVCLLATFMTRMSNDRHREQDHKFDDTIPPRAYGLELEPEIVRHYSIFQRRLHYTKGFSSTRPDTHDLMTLSHLAMYVLAGLTEDGFVHAM